MIDRIKTDRLKDIHTPSYFYDLEVLRETLEVAKAEAETYGFKVHYAIKANSNPGLLKIISSYGFGADCVSGKEIIRAVENGFSPSSIAFAGVGKTDNEIITGLQNNIFSFNIESIQELKVINELAGNNKKKARIAIRINPDVDAMTHKHTTTGIEDSKFGIDLSMMESVVEVIKKANNIELTGLHFHIGSQVKGLSPFKELCFKINDLQKWFNARDIYPQHINVGGGLWVNYDEPEEMPDFKAYFALFKELLDLRNEQELHFELGRSLIAQSGSLITKVLYIKKGGQNDFVIVDAGMTDLIRPALYQAFHKIENLTSTESEIIKYNVVGPICESTDSFGKFIELPITKRGDLLAIRSAGAYGEVMTSNYNLRDKPGTLLYE